MMTTCFQKKQDILTKFNSTVFFLINDMIGLSKRIHNAIALIKNYERIVKIDRL